jgi:hypothetical protein
MFVAKTQKKTNSIIQHKVFWHMNDFLKAVSNEAYTENGALAYKSTGLVIADQFGKAGTYRDRTPYDAYLDQEKLWEENKEYAIKFPFYLRMITRKVKKGDGMVTENSQKGQGARDESLKRFLWMAERHPNIFYKNLWLLPVVGSWKDLWTLLLIDEEGVLDKDKIFDVISRGLKGEMCDLVKKYLPQIRANAKCTTERARKLNALAKEFCHWVGLSYKEYREIKASGKAHKFQQFISQEKYDLLNWNTIPGKALLNLVSSKFITNHGLADSYMEWITQTPIAKFNGYPYELGKKMFNGTLRRRDYLTTNKMLMMTLDAQFENLIRTAKDGREGIQGNVWCAIDTSGSMEVQVCSDGTTAYDVCVALGIFFATLNEGDFYKNIIMFDSVSRVKQLSGTFSEMYRSIVKSSTAWGSTNFQSVIDEIVRIRLMHPEISLDSYPQTLLVVSDMEFDPSDDMVFEDGQVSISLQQTNYEAAKKKLKACFPEEWVEQFKIVWWQVDGEDASSVPSTLEDGGTYFFSGFDGSVISLLLGGEAKTEEAGEGTEGVKNAVKTMQELIHEVLNQEILQLVDTKE